MIRTTLQGEAIEVSCIRPEVNLPGHLLAIAFATDISTGAAVVPYGRNLEGSTVFLPFRADQIFLIRTTDRGIEILTRRWKITTWGALEEVRTGVETMAHPGELRVRIPLNGIGSEVIRFTAYAKDLRQNDGWGEMLPDDRLGIPSGFNDTAVARYLTAAPGSGKIVVQNRLGSERPRIYQLLPRLFGNTNETRKPNGTLAENGCGKFADINDAALAALREMSITHLWLTGVLQQATATDYSEIGAPADDPDLLKGLAGSPYAIKDYFDVCPDYAVQPAHRLEEFRALLDRIHTHGMKAIIDFVPNHVARSYHSDVKPDLSFGASDNPTTFFDPRNNFYYLRPEDHGHGPPLMLPTVADGAPASPTCRVLGTCDGKYDGELTLGRVTGNNSISWAPKLDDWYETVKLNYGFDFTTSAREYPHGDQREKAIPDTWLKMDRILAFWQEMGVDGFRCDMAHMVPPEFWQWAIGRARQREPGVWFMAEAYGDDPSKVQSGDALLNTLNNGSGDVMFDLLSAGFDAVYDHPSYKKLKAIYDGPGWANDLDQEQPHSFIFHNSLRYAENHDEVRLAGRNHWGGAGMNVGRVVTPVLYALGRGPVMLYHGQEMGEPADGEEGFSGDDARTTIYDYWSMPAFTGWVNGHRYDGGKLTPEQRELRDFHARLLRLVSEPAFRDGEFFPLNPPNIGHEQFGRLPGESASGHWLYAFLRVSAEQRFLVIANLHPAVSLEGVCIMFPNDAAAFLRTESTDLLTFHERLSPSESMVGPITAADLLRSGLPIRNVPPLTAYFLEIAVQPA